MKTFAGTLAIMVLLSGCQSPSTFYMNGVIVWASTSAFGFGYGEYIEVAPGGKVDRKIKGEKDTLTLKIDNKAVKVEEEGKGEVK